MQRGPAYEAAFDAEGNATKACEGFARAKGITPKELEVREECGRRFVYYVTRSESRPTAGLLPDICLKIVRDMYFPKNMRWGYRDVRFSRPVRWLVALWGETVIPFGYAGSDLGQGESRASVARQPGRHRHARLLRGRHALGQSDRRPRGARAAHVGRAGEGRGGEGPEGHRSARQDGRGALSGGMADRG